MTAGPVLLATSHGTSDPAGQRAVLALVDAVAAAAPQLTVRGGYVDVQSPDAPSCLRALAAGSAPVESAPAESSATESAPAESASADSASTDSAPAESAPAESAPAESAPTKSAASQSALTESAAAESVAAALARPVVIVPLLLSAGYHVRVDLAEAADGAAQPVRVTGALGPDLRLARILAARLREIGLRPDDTVVLAAAGSTDTAAVADCHAMAGRLAAVLGRPVTVGFISAAEPRLADAVLTARAGASARVGASGRVVVATYLLAPGYFAGLAERCGADAVSRPLLVDGEAPPADLVDVVIDRYSAIARLELALAGLPWSFSPGRTD